MQKTNFPRIHYIIYIYFFQQEKEIFIKIFVFLADCLFLSARHAYIIQMMEMEGLP